MKMFHALSALLLLTVTTLSLAQSERDAERKRAEAFYAKADNAVSTGHFDTYFGMFAASFYTVDTEGRQMDLAHYKAECMSFVKRVKDLRLKTTIKNVQLQDGEAMVWVEEKITYKIQVNGKWVPFTKTERYADGMANTSRGWTFTSSQQLLTDEPWPFKTNGG